MYSKDIYAESVEEVAARRIQSLWRRYSNMQIYRYYRDLIKFRDRGNPALMLRCINPREAQLLDAASGAYVRFRLGGEIFPPSIFYKIFLGNPLCDVGSYAPRDYTEVAEDERKPAARATKSSWYRRTENNEWRPVSESLLRTLTGEGQNQPKPPVKAVPFHHSKNVRSKFAQLRRRRKRMDWLKRLYKEELEKMVSEARSRAATREQGEGGTNIRVTTSGDSASEHAEDADEEILELVDWTNSLDFETYYGEWFTMATTRRAEVFVRNLDELVEDDSGDDEPQQAARLAAAAPPTTVESPRADSQDLEIASLLEKKPRLVISSAGVNL